GQTMGINDDINLNPYVYRLLDNFPNPFNPETHIHFELGGQEIVKIMIYDALGRQVRTLVNGQSYRPGFHAVNRDGRDNNSQSVPSGVYIYRIKAGSFIADKKMLLVK
ncbi:MAG: T9SS type A sorting domain-containing protein, partial [Candidatus Neomarinimicrobiota bacterium]|nr:T9SS type A sorting domain-containing protein [Candidatus Neomarinimicrobiota bacterium]